MMMNMVASIDTVIGNIPLAAPQEVSEIVDNWNDTEAPELISEELISDRFRSIAKKFPDAVALVIADEQITFRELDRRSELLYTYLRSIGVTPEAMVAVSMDRSIELIVTLLGQC